MKSTSPDSMWHSRTSGQRARAFLEMLEIGILLAGQADKDKAGDLKAQRLAVQLGVIALDDSRPSPARGCGAGRAAR